MNRAAIKRRFLAVCGFFGCFGLARHLTRSRLRILCYHGFSIGDQHEFSPLLFIRPDTFDRHLKLIVQMGIPVVSLNDGLKLLRTNAVRHGETVITIDDGWKSTLLLGAERLRMARLPACLYVTSYYVGKPAAVFNVVVRYMLWRCRGQVIDVRGVDPQIDGTVDLRTDREDTANRWIAYADAEFDWRQREELLGRLADALGLDIRAVLADGRFSLLDEREVAELSQYGVDVQLHTHRHTLSDTDFSQVKREIDDNRAVLEAIKGAACDHFCYPSGAYGDNHPSWLRRLGVDSATTCEPGLNDSSTNPYLLHRYLAREDAPDIELAAELSGFSEILRRGRTSVRSLVSTVSRRRAA